jgi:hypothetical protein
MKAYVINLHDRLDRWNVAEPHLRGHGFDVQRYIGQRRATGHAGCVASHLGALASAGEAPFIIFEDDAEIIGDTWVLAKAIQELGTFDMLFLGCAPQEKMKPVSQHALRLGRAYQTHAIVYGSNRVVDFILSQRHLARKIDVFFSEEVIPFYNCYATNPMICRQRESHSDITNKVVSHDEIVDHFNNMIW